MDGLEYVLPAGHQHYERVFYDAVEGSYYDRATDLFITIDEFYSFVKDR